MSSTPPPGQRFGRFEIRVDERRLLVDGQPVVGLGTRAFDVLLALVERRDRMVSKSELLDLVWAGLVVEENNLQVQVSTLRKLLGAQAITTIPGRGYRFTAALEQGAAAPAETLDVVSSHPPRPAASMAGNVPAYLPPLLGRDDELHAVQDLVAAHPLVTVVGAGGMGKTTLANAAAAALREHFADGVWIVELAPLADGALLPQAVAQALGITIGQAGAAQDALLGVLSSQAMLLVLDNAEHLVAAVAGLAAAIISRAPGVRLLVTSQERLNLKDERSFALGVLSLPAGGEAPSVRKHGAVALFVDRARAVDPRFALDTGNAEAVADICRGLDGMPLAIELAAARVRMLGVQGVRDKLHERFKLLTSGARTALPKHQTLHAALDWSHTLLSAAEQAVLRRLGVFVGGLSLELAQQVAADQALDEWAVLDALSALVDKSLVAAEGGEPPRYRLLETTRAYALERLHTQGETAAISRRHALAVRDLFINTERARYGDEGTLNMADFMHRLAPELDNLRHAFTWAAGQGRQIATAVALAATSAEVLRQLGMSQEALRRMLLLASVVDDNEEPQTAAVFWLNLGTLGTLGRLPRDEVLGSERRAEQLLRSGGQRRRLYLSHFSKAWALNTMGEHAAAAHLAAKMKVLELDTDPPWMRALLLRLLAGALLIQDRIEECIALMVEEQAMLLHEPGEQNSLITCQNNLCAALNSFGRHQDAEMLALSVIESGRRERLATVGYTRFQLLHAQVSLQRIEDARATLREAIPHWQRDGMLIFGCHILAAFLAELGRWADAARLDGAAATFLARAGLIHTPVRRQAQARTLRLFSAAGLDPADIERWMQEGAAMDEEAIAALCLKATAA